MQICRPLRAKTANRALATRGKQCVCRTHAKKQQRLNTVTLAVFCDDDGDDDDGNDVKFCKQGQQIATIGVRVETVEFDGAYAVQRPL